MIILVEKGICIVRYHGRVHIHTWKTLRKFLKRSRRAMGKTNMFKSLRNKIVKLDRGSADSNVGKIIAVKDDYLALLTKDEGIIYYALEHIQSVTENVKHPHDFEVKIENIKHLPDTLASLLSTCNYDWVEVQLENGQMEEGVVNKVDDGVLTMVDHKKVIRIVMKKINNVSIGVRPK